MSQLRDVDRDEWRTVLGILKRLCEVELYNSRKLTRRRSWEEDACRIEALLSAQDEGEQECTFPKCDCKRGEELVKCAVHATTPEPVTPAPEQPPVFPEHLVEPSDNERATLPETTLNYLEGLEQRLDALQAELDEARRYMGPKGIRAVWEDNTALRFRLEKAEEQRDELRRLVEIRLEAGHNDTCGSLLVPGSPCSCGHRALSVYTTEMGTPDGEGG